MSVLVKGMEIPMYWYECPFCSDGYCFMIPDENDRICLVDSKEDTHRNENCPLAPVPKHGRLIDADALTKDLVKRWNVNDDQDFCNKEVWRGIEDAPTVIEAEEGE